MQEVLTQTEGLGLSREMVVAALRNHMHNTVTASYYLLLNRKRQRVERDGATAAGVRCAFGHPRLSRLLTTIDPRLRVFGSVF